MVGPHGGNYGSLVPAIGALLTAAVPPRTTDAGNTRASAALPGGGAWDGAARLTDDPGAFARVDADITCPVDAAGMFYVIHGPTVALANACNPAAPVLPCRVDAWPAITVWAAQRAPVRLRDKAYRLAWRGTAGSVVAIDATLDPREIAPHTPLRSEAPALILAGANATFNRPPGARGVSLGDGNNSGTGGGIATTCWLSSAGGASVASYWSKNQNPGYAPLVCIPIPGLTAAGTLVTEITVRNNEGVNSGVVMVEWYT